MVNLLQIGGTSKIMGYTFDFHQTIYRKDVEMRKVMSDYPKRGFMDTNTRFIEDIRT